MKRRKSRPLTELELEIMNVIWDGGAARVEEIRATLENGGRPLALPSIRTMLGILMDKGYLSREPSGRAHLYSPRVSREAAHKGILSDLLHRAFDGSALSMVATLLDARMVPKRDLYEVKRLLREYEKEKPK